MKSGASTNIGGGTMLHGGMTSGGQRIGGIGVDSPYADILSQSIVDARNILGIFNPQTNTNIDPRTGRPYTYSTGMNINPATGLPYSTVNPATGLPYGVQQSGVLGSMDTTTMLAIGAIGIGVLYFMMK